MRNGWTETTLGDVAEVLDRMRKPVSGAEREKRQGPVPYYGATGQAGWIDAPIFDEELVLLGEDAIDFLNPLVHKAYLISGPSWVNNHAHVLRARRERVLAYFLMEALNAVDYSRFVAFGTRSKLTQSAMMDITINLPPLAEQKRIVDVVSSVDAYIDALRKQADTARAARNAVLHELLFAGGDDWTETTLGEVCRLVKGISYKSDELVSKGEGVPFINLKSIDRGGGFRSDGLKWFLGKHKQEQVVRPGDLVLCCTDLTKEKAILGYPLLVPKLEIGNEFCISLDMATLIVDKDVSSNKFMYLVLQGNQMREFMTTNSSGTTVMHLQTRNVGNARFLLPPLDEQKRIVEIVSSMDEVIQSTQQAVVDAKSLRSGLLSDLLSGEHEIPASYDVFVGAA